MWNSSWASGPHLRVGLLIYGSLDTISGGYLYDRKLVESLRKQGDEVQVLSLPWRSYARCLSDNFSAALRRQLEQAPLDVLLQDELNHPSLFWLNHWLRRRIHYPVLSIIHHLRCSEQRPAWQNRFYRWVERRYLASVDGYIFNSQTTRQVVQNLVGADGIRPLPGLVACPAGDRFNPHITPEILQQRALQPGPLRLFFLGNLIPRKGLHILIQALTHLPGHAWTLHAAGSLETDPAYTQAIRQQIRAGGLAENIHLLGQLLDDELARQMQASHLLVVPSSYEGFGIAYLEGMSFGLPAIATRSGAASEIITDDQDGYLLPPDDPAALAVCLERLAQDRQRLLRLSLAARQRFLAAPTWEQSMARIGEFLHTLAVKNTAVEQP